MKLITPLIEDRIKSLVGKRHYQAARALARQYPDDAKAQQYLEDIDLLAAPTGAEKVATSVLKYMAIAALIGMVVMVLIVLFTIYWINR